LEHRGHSHHRGSTTTWSPDGAPDSTVPGRQATAKSGSGHEQSASGGSGPGRAPAARRSLGRKRHDPDQSESVDLFLSADFSEPPLSNTSDDKPASGKYSADRTNTPANPASSHVKTANPKLLGDLTTGILLLDISGIVNWMNPAAEDLLGISFQRAFNRPLDGLVPGIETLVELVTRARLERQSFGHAINIPSPQRDGSEQELAVRVSILGEAAEDQLLLEIFNLTQRHQLDRENSLIAQHGASRQMLRRLAHEIRNPLGGLRGAAQLLERELGDPALREFTQVIIGEADRLAGLMDNLLGPGSKPDLKMVNVHELLEYVATITESEWPDQRIQRDYDPSLPDLFVDRDQLTQAFLNLLRNAVQAISAKGVIVMRTRVLTNQVLNKNTFKLVALIEIEDNGPGVPADITDTLFFPLVTGRNDGTGLGLPLAQDLVNRHQGLIEYESEPGRTVFIVHLPILPAPVDLQVNTL
jgi:two-component system nitrogen regulation sensor histidine kinase GlnL